MTETEKRITKSSKYQENMDGREPVDIDPQSDYWKAVELVGSKILSVFMGSERKVGVYNTVAVRNRRLLDSNDEFLEYEAPLITAIEATVSSGDDVLLIGGGLGVSTVVAARHVGEDGTVHTIEASSDRLPILTETVNLNGVRERVTIQHGIVEMANKVDGSAADGEVIDASDLSDCDVLISDCEGAEQQLLDSYSGTPRAIIVETHGVYGSPTESVVATLNDNGYSEQKRAPESTSDDVMVVTATR